LVAESQPSQILREVLRVAKDPPKDTPPNELDSYMDDDSPAAGSRIAPRYHYHGLAVTQTESQLDDSPVPQKESTIGFVDDMNEGHDNQTLSFSLKNPFDTIDSSRSAHLAGARHPSCVPKTTKAVSFVSPRTITGTNQVKIKQPRPLQPSSGPRSPSPASQDSFAGPPLRRDPEQEFLAASKQFCVPLSELGISPEVSCANLETWQSPTPFLLYRVQYSQHYQEP
jgi:hypothetical protein